MLYIPVIDLNNYLHISNFQPLFGKLNSIKIEL